MQKLFLLLDKLSTALNDKAVVKLTLSDKKNKESEISSTHVTLVELKGKVQCKVVTRFKTKDVTKNYSFAEALILIENLLTKDFLQANLKLSSSHIHYMRTSKGKEKIVEQKVQEAEVSMDHNRKKKKLVLAQRPYLVALGISNKEGKILKGKSSKFNQINKYIELLSTIIDSADLKDGFSIVDMGCGRGYLTFALYDYLQSHKKIECSVIGIEMRPGLVKECNNISESCAYENLKFIEGYIDAQQKSEADIVIALHACDTATDDAIAYGINNKSQVIVCSPCCHKQIRKEINRTNIISAITDYGIQLERTAEMITDTIRALVLNYYGYRTKIMEFIDSNHTPKNLLITGEYKKAPSATQKQAILDQINQLKKQFGIEKHYLQEILNIK